METIEPHLYSQTLAHVRQLAASRHCTIEALLKECLERLGVAEAAGDPFLEMCADKLALIDQVVASAMQVGVEHLLRVCGG